MSINFECRSVLTYYVVSHMPSICFIIGQFLIFHNTLSIAQLIRISLILFSAFAYGFVRISEQKQPLSKQSDADAVPKVVSNL